MPMSRVEVEQALRRLRLSGMNETLDARAHQANQGETAFMDAFALLLQDEIDRRRSKLIERRYVLSGLPERKHMTGFDWQFNPKLPRGQILELMSMSFVRAKEAALLIGHPGTGKSHIAKAVGLAAIVQGMRVYYREAHVLFEELFAAENLQQKKKLMKTISESDLLIIDDLGLRRLKPEDGEDILEIVMNRYEKKSTLITSNRIIADWSKMLGDATLSSAVLDRLLHHCQNLRFEGKSYRLGEAAARIMNEGEHKEAV